MDDVDTSTLDIVNKFLKNNQLKVFVSARRNRVHNLFIYEHARRKVFYYWEMEVD